MPWKIHPRPIGHKHATSRVLCIPHPVEVGAGGTDARSRATGKSLPLAEGSCTPGAGDNSGSRRIRVSDDALSETNQPGLRIAEPVEVHAHPVHDTQVKAAQLAVVVAGREIVERSAGFQPATEAADGDHR